jgi:alpha-glucosidase
MADPWREQGAMRFEGQDGPRLAFAAREGPGRAELTLLEDDVVRLRWYPTGAPRVTRTWAVVGRAGDVGHEGRERADLSVFTCPEPRVEVGEERVVIEGARVRVEVTLDPFALRYRLPDGSVVLEDHPELAYRRAGDEGRGVRHTLRRDPREVFLGLGEASGGIDRHHRRHRLRPSDALGYDAERSDPLYKHLPIVLSLTPDGHAAGLLYDTGAETVVDLGCEIDHYVGPFRYTEVRACDLDLYVLVGPALSDVVRRVQDLTGHAPLAPRWSLGYLGSTMRYTDAEDPRSELAGFVDELRRHDLGCSGFHLSSGYSLGDDGLRYVFEWNRRRVPEPAAMLEPLRDAGIRTLANVKPALLTSHPDYAELAERGAFVRRAATDGDGPYRGRFWGGQGSYLDFSDAAAYDWWRARLRERILEVGIDASWNDNNEFQIADDAARCAAGEAGDLRPVLTLLMNHASRAAQRDVRPEARDYQVTRSGGLGTQRYAQTWSGDNVTTWHTLAFNLPMGLSMSLCGWANHGHDVGGFAGPPPDPELLVRWIEQGVTMPRFTIHSWNDDGSATEPWSHPEVVPLVRRLMRLRTALVPYLATLQHAACERGEPITRPLVYAFQDWRPGWRESFVHMLGPALLVAPVLEPGARTRRALLPPGAWLELATGRTWAGDGWADLDAPLGQPALLLREGHALPLADVGAVDEPRPAWLAGGAGVAPPAITWLAQPSATGALRGELVWDDGVSRAFERGAVDRFVVEGAAEGALAGRESTVSMRVSAASGCGVGPHRVLVPGGAARVPWFGSGWSSVGLRVVDG